MSAWHREHPELAGHPDRDPWMRNAGYAKVAPMSEVERDQLRDEREQFEQFCWQCGHSEDAHSAEARGCTHPECSCAQVPES